jgi:hypothetical protein
MGASADYSACSSAAYNTGRFASDYTCWPPTHRAGRYTVDCPGGDPDNHPRRRYSKPDYDDYTEPDNDNYAQPNNNNHTQSIDSEHCSGKCPRSSCARSEHRGGRDGNYRCAL